MSKNILYLGSKSIMRQRLLDLSGITYCVLEQTSDECDIDVTQSFTDYVKAIAKQKMAHVVIPQDISKDAPIFVLTADTLMRLQRSQTILGKPKDKDDARRMLTLLRTEPIELVTACCLAEKKWDGTAWQTEAEQTWATPAILEFHVEDDEMDEYFAKMPHALAACGAGVIEAFGLNFLKRIDGSFAAVLGLPLFELRGELKKIGF